MVTFGVHFGFMKDVVEASGESFVPGVGILLLLQRRPFRGRGREIMAMEPHCRKEDNVNDPLDVVRYLCRLTRILQRERGLEWPCTL